MSEAEHSIECGMAVQILAPRDWRMGEGPLQRVAGGVGARSGCVVCWLRGCGRIPLAVRMFWRRWRCVRLLCGGPNPLTRGLTALRWCLCVSAALCEHVLF
ncbi:retrotransposon hot spot (RHS) protein [Trypanosoma cruzi]|nr:retrotransposon hot spot (RHS) protein [Trypanosoma cruzi]